MSLARGGQVGLMGFATTKAINFVSAENGFNGTFLRQLNLAQSSRQRAVELPKRQISA